MKRLILISALFMGTSSLVSAAPCKTVPECHKHLKAMAALLKQDEEELKKMTAELEEAKAVAESEKEKASAVSSSAPKTAPTKGAKKAAAPVEEEDEPLEDDTMGDEEMEESMPAKPSRSSAKPAPTKGAKKAEAPVEEEDEPLEEEAMGDEDEEISEDVPAKSSPISGKTAPAPKKKGGVCSSVAECHRDLKEMAGHLRADAEEIQQLEDEITELQDAMETCTGSTRIEFTDEEKRVSSVGKAGKKTNPSSSVLLEEDTSSAKKSSSAPPPPPPPPAAPPPPPPGGGKTTHAKGGESKKPKAPHEAGEADGEGRGALLAAIHKGAKLRKTDGPAERDAQGNKIERDDAPAAPEKSGKASASKASSEDAHLAAIHKGIKLRKTDGPAERNAKGEKIDKSGKPVKATATGGGGLQGILSAHFQKTRPQINGEDEEEDENENQENKDW